ncbi:MAG: hypothetical protein WCO60_19190 [Verrucomicrobiota bacterium]
MRLILFDAVLWGDCSSRGVLRRGGKFLLKCPQERKQRPVCLFLLAVGVNASETLGFIL